MNRFYKVLVWTAVVLSFMAIMLVCFKVKPLPPDFFGALVGVMTFLVAVLAVLIVINYFSFENKIKKYIIEELDKEKRLLKHRMDGMLLMERAQDQANKNIEEEMVDILMDAIAEFNQCNESEFILDALNQIEQQSERYVNGIGSLRMYNDRIGFYHFVLKQAKDVLERNHINSITAVNMGIIINNAKKI